MFNRAKKQREQYSSKPTFSYYKANKNANTQNNNSKISNFLKNLPVFSSLVVMAVCVGYVISLNSNPTIKIINSDTQELAGINIDKDKYSKIIQQLLNNSVMNKSKITINSEKLESEIYSRITEATDIAVTLPIISRSPVVYIRIAEPAATLQTSTNKLFIIDEKGRAVKEADSKDSINLISVVDNSGLTINIGNQAIPQSQLEFIQQVDAQLKAKKINPNEFIYSNNANELIVSLKRKDFVAKFNLAGNPRSQSGTLIATLKYLKARNINPTKYIDVRVEERAYYK